MEKTIIATSGGARSWRQPNLKEHEVSRMHTCADSREVCYDTIDRLWELYFQTVPLMTFYRVSVA